MGPLGGPIWTTPASRTEKLFKNPKNREERDRRIREAFLLHGYRLNEIATAIRLHCSRVIHIANEGGGIDKNKVISQDLTVSSFAYITKRDIMSLFYFAF